MTLACTARLVSKTTMEAQGSGFCEMKAMLFGKVILHYLRRGLNRGRKEGKRIEIHQEPY